jgi:hypothetical protein
LTSKRFFFEKKKQKTSICLGRWHLTRHNTQRIKIFLLLFVYKNERFLLFCWPHCEPPPFVVCPPAMRHQKRPA